MDGTFLVRALLLARPALVTLVGTVKDSTGKDTLPADRIRAGDLPEGTPLPAIGIEEVSGTDRRTLGGAPGGKVKVTARVQLTVIAASYLAMKTLMAQARFACRDFVGTIGGVSGVTAWLESKGPDFTTDAGWYAQTQDVMITFDDIAA